VAWRRKRAYLRSLVLGAVRLLGVGPLSSGLRVAWGDRRELRMTLSTQEALEEAALGIYGSDLTGNNCSAEKVNAS
jgi:hypothetical protein